MPGGYNAYNVLGYVMEELMREGFCAACFGEAFSNACQNLGVNPTQHTDAGTVH